MWLGSFLSIAVALSGPAAIAASSAPAAVGSTGSGPADVATHSLGWIPTAGLPTGLSTAGAALAQPAAALPQSFDLSAWAAPVGNQGSVGSCASWAVGYYYRYWLRNHATGETATFAPMYLYAQLSKGVDGGSSFQGNIGIMQTQGIAHTSDYPQGDYDFTTQPSTAETTAASSYKVSGGTWLFNGPSDQNQVAVEASIASGKPVLLGIPVYDNFMSATAASDFVDVPVPGMTDWGGHALFAPKYDANGVWVENSWGTSWGNHGWAELSWEFVNKYVDEAWNISGDGPSPWTVSLQASSATVAGGSSVTLTAAANQGVYGSSLSVAILTDVGDLVTSCWYGATCVASVSEVGPAIATYHAVVGQWDGSSPVATSDPVTIAWSAPPPLPPPSTGLSYVAMTPVRLLDTRNGTGLAGRLVADAAATFQVTGRGGVPSSARAVTGNLTVTQQSSPGFLYLGPSPLDHPNSSTLNFPMGDDRANSVTVSLGDGGTLSVTYVAPVVWSTAQAIFDVTGYFTTDAGGATYHALSPARILDSRDGTGLSGAFSSHVARPLQVTGHGGVPAGAVAVTANLTVTQQTSAGFLFVGPTSMDNPTSSTLNFPMGDDRANSVTVALSSSGVLFVTYAAASLGPTAHVLFDVTGYFTSGPGGATYHAMAPTRLLDSRVGTGLSSGFSSHVARPLQIAGIGVPADAMAVTGNLTVTQQTNLGFLYAGPNAMDNPTSSVLNFPPRDDRANAVTMALNSGGGISITYAAPSLGSTAQVIFDVTGYFTAAG